MSGELASLLLVLASSDEDGSTCPLSRFVKDVMERTPSNLSLAQAVTSYSQSLASEEGELTQLIERSHIARDKLVAELHRIDAQIAQSEKRKTVISSSKKYCRVAINAIATGNLKPMVEVRADTPKQAQAAPAAGLLPSHSVELPEHLSGVPMINFPVNEKPRSGPVPNTSTDRHDFDVDGLIGVLSIGDINEGTLMHALQGFEANFAQLVDTPWLADDAGKVGRLTDALICHVPLPRPPTQQTELRILSSVFKRCANQPPPRGSRLLAEEQQNAAIDAVVRLLASVNDDVKSEALDALSHMVTTDACRKRFSDAGGVEPLVNIVASSTNEALLERALVFMWMILSSSDSLRIEVRECGGMRAALDLLYTDSMPILENVAMSIGYITREEQSKIAIRESGGLEKIAATLQHPSESIQTKIAGAVWNCASNTENRALLRQLGCIPALIELLHQPHEHVQENAAGALWNLSVDAENKTQILDYGGISALIRMLQTSKSSSVIENVTGTLWNCSAMLENRAAIRKCGGIVPLISYLRSGNEKIQDNCAGALRNCAINDQNKTAIREAGGVELVFELLPHVPHSTQDKLIAMMWILTASPEVKHAVRLCGGINQLIHSLRSTQLPTQEKIIGVLRNCATEPTNRQPMIDLGVIGGLVDVVSSNFDRISSTAKEATASAVWYLCRDDKVTARKEHGLHLMCKLLSDSCTAVVEHAAGALSSLTITVPENRDAVREEGGLDKLLELLVTNYEVSTMPPGQQSAGQPSTYAYALMNILLSIRNATSANEANMKIAAGYSALPKAIVFVVSKGSEEFAKEAALCIKNLSLDRQCVEELVSMGVVAGLSSLAERGSSDAVRKAAAMALQSVTRYSGGSGGTTSVRR